MAPAGALANRFGAHQVMATSALLGALAILSTTLASNLQFMIAAQLAAGAAWGCILVAAFSLAFAVGESGREGTMTGVLFSALAIATFARMAMVAAGFAGNPQMHAVLQWAPTMYWTIAGLGLLYFSALQLRAA